MKTSVLTATGFLAVVTLVGAGARAQSYQSNYWDGYRGGAPDYSYSNGNNYSYGNMYGTSEANSRSPAYGSPYRDSYGSSYYARQDESYGGGYGRANQGYYQAPSASYSQFTTSGPAGQAQRSAPQAESTPQIEQPAYGGLTDGFDGTCGAADECGPYQTKPVQWMVAADAVFLTRVRGNTYPLLKVPSSVPPPAYSHETVVLDAADFDFDYEPGARVTASRMLCDGWGVEAGFLGMSDGWGFGNTYVGILELQGPGWSLGSDPTLPNPTPVAFRVNNTSEFYSGELNLTRGICDWATLRLGVRYIEFNDRLEVDELYTPLYNLLISTADNNLIGMQLGADFKLLELGGCGVRAFADECGYADGYGLRHGALRGRIAGAGGACRFRINATINGGVFYNFIEHDPYSSVFGPPLVSEANEVALLGEVALTAKYRLTDHVAIRGGYHVLALHGVALAPDQIATSDVVTETASTKLGSLIAHGATLGLEVFW